MQEGITESSMQPFSHEHFMRQAFRQAEKAYRIREVPIGAVVVHGGTVIGCGYNQTEQLQDPTAHAEMIAITAASESLGSRRLLDCTMYVTLEPCCMCAGAIVLARIPKVVFGAYDQKAGAVKTLYTITQDTRLNHSAEVIGGILEQECGGILSHFFAELRKQKRNN
jgi:tRNA(adenine34) deaminase